MKRGTLKGKSVKYFTARVTTRRLSRINWTPFVQPLLIGVTISSIITAPAPSAADPTIVAEVRELVSDYSWGYESGLKQPQGSYKDGRSIYSVSRRTRPTTIPNRQPAGIPDALVWVDERNDNLLALPDPRGLHQEGVNPGGNIVFSASVSPAKQGEMWWVTGGRANEIPFDLSRSRRPFDPRVFDVVLDDFETTERSTAPTLSVSGSTGLVVYRYLHSTRPNGAVVFQRYNLEPTDPILEEEGAIGRASPAGGLGTVTVEQVWSRWDPRKNAVAATWQWYGWSEGTRFFGSNPFVFTDDFGNTWKLADGSVVTDPLTYATQTATSTPYDHLGRREHALWYTRDLGFGVQGNPWIALPVGRDAREIRFFFWTGSNWESRSLTVDLDDGDPVACGATKDYIVCALSERSKSGALLIRVTRDDGRTWSNPVEVDDVSAAHGESSNRISFVSFVQPADEYADNAARFFFGYSKQADGEDGLSYQNNIRWIKLQIGDSPGPSPLRADFNGDGRVDREDRRAFLASFRARDLRADFDADGVVKSADRRAFISAWLRERIDQRVAQGTN
jgi:hypothetical protein